MCNNIELSFKDMGIDWKIEVIEEDHYIDTVVSVSAYDGKKYVELDVDTVEFQQDHEDMLNEAIEEYYTNLRLAHEDMMYETAREEGRL